MPNRACCWSGLMLLGLVLLAGPQAWADDALSRDERAALALACRQDRLAGDGAEAACRTRELEQAAVVVRPAALELLTLAEQLRLGAVCGPAQALGPAELRACQESGIRARAFLAELEPPSDGLEDVALSAGLGDIAPAAAPVAE